MISPKDFFDELKHHDIDFYAGVPDSLLKNLCAYITDHLPADRHIIAANEGGAVGLAAGYHLSTGKIPVVYMQNSGLGNTVNPLMSLTDKLVYHIPVLLVIGWRGEPGVKDEPQHRKQGLVTLPLLEAMGIQWINVNLSPNQFVSRDIPKRFRVILAEYNIPTDLIHLELTEQSMIDFSLMREQIIELHKSGFEFALDDYGSGYSNLTRVRQYPFSNIKIDMEVVRNYYRDPDPLLPALLKAFKQMNFSITAEGIETEEMADALREIGCDYFQGYYFSRPLPMEEFLQLAS